MRTNTWAVVFLKLNLAKALEQGFTFWRSSNGLVLTEGPIPVKLLTPVDKEELV